MTTPTRPGRGPQPPDREPGPVGLLARIFLTQFLVVLAVAAVIASVFILAGGDDDRSASEGAAASSASPTATASTKAEASSPPPTESAAPATETPAPPTASAAEPGPAQAKGPKVDVLNQSAGGNAAARTADRLREAGWRIGRVDDFRGNVSMTTVYYPEGLTTEAQAVAADLPGSPRVMQRFSTLSDKRVTVILVD
jgi:pyruvate/2-oxoglutarate dehydrogenase complex dihydrolipoamide acyltransferase (E2) component